MSRAEWFGFLLQIVLRIGFNVCLTGVSIAVPQDASPAAAHGMPCLRVKGSHRWALLALLLQIAAERHGMAWHSMHVVCLCIG